MITEAELDQYRPMCIGLARRFSVGHRSSGLLVDDLIQEALLGVCVGMERWSPRMPASKKTWAFHCAVGAIKHYLRDYSPDSVIRVPAWFQENGGKAPVVLSMDCDPNDHSGHFVLEAPDPSAEDDFRRAEYRATLELLAQHTTLSEKQAAVLHKAINGIVFSGTDHQNWQTVRRKLRETAERLDRKGSFRRKCGDL